MTLVSLRRVAAFTELLNYHLCSRTRGLSSRASRALQNDNQSVPRTSPVINEEIISSKYESSLHLSVLFSNTVAQVDDYKIELVDDEAWRVSQGLAQSWRVTTPALEAKSSATRVVDKSVNYVPPNKEDPDIDEIEDMRIRGNLFYKLDRSSKEFEEYNFDFHRKKSDKSKGDRAESKKKEDPNSNSASKLEFFSKKGDEQKESKKKEDPSSYLASKLEKSSKARDQRKESKEKEDPSSNSASKLEKSFNARDQRKESKKKEEPNSNLTSELKKSFKNREERMESKKENAGNNFVSRGECLPEINESDETDGSCYGKRPRIPTFNQLTAPYHEPFCLDIYISKASVRACIIHRATSKVVAVAHSISKDMKFDLGSTRNATACAAVGQVLAQRALADDIHNAVYTPRKGEKLEGKLQIVLEAIIGNGINVKVKIKQRKFRKSHLPHRA